MAEIKTVEDAAHYYAECCNGGSRGSGIVQQSFKAGAEWREKHPEKILENFLTWIEEKAKKDEGIRPADKYECIEMYIKELQ